MCLGPKLIHTIWNYKLFGLESWYECSYSGATWPTLKFQFSCIVHSNSWCLRLLKHAIGWGFQTAEKILSFFFLVLLIQGMYLSSFSQVGLGWATFFLARFGLGLVFLATGLFGPSSILVYFGPILTNFSAKSAFFWFGLGQATQNLAQARSGHSKPLACRPNLGPGFGAQPSPTPKFWYQFSGFYRFI